MGQSASIWDSGTPADGTIELINRKTGGPDGSWQWKRGQWWEKQNGSWAPSPQDHQDAVIGKFVDIIGTPGGPYDGWYFDMAANAWNAPTAQERTNAIALGKARAEDKVFVVDASGKVVLYTPPPPDKPSGAMVPTTQQTTAMTATTTGGGAGMGGGGMEVSMDFDELIELVGEALPAIIDPPPVPTLVPSDSDSNFGNLFLFIAAEAAYAKRDEQIRAGADAVRVFMRSRNMTRISSKDLIRIAGEAIITLTGLPAAPTVVKGDPDTNFKNLFIYLEALSAHEHRDEQIRAGATGIGFLIRRYRGDGKRAGA
jgi:hypothetical protein